MSIFRTIAMFLYLFGYMIVHYNILRRGERALAAGDMDTVEQIVNEHIPHWSRQILHITGVQLLVEGLDNIPKDTACVFVGNHRSYYDIPLLLAGLEPFKKQFVISGEDAGLHLLLTAKGNVTEQELLERAAAEKVKAYGMSENMVASAADKATVLLGFGSMDEADMKEGLRRLQNAWL